jgi:hypothetical protein
VPETCALGDGDGDRGALGFAVLPGAVGPGVEGAPPGRDSCGLVGGRISTRSPADRFDVLGTATIAYWVIDPRDSLVKAAGTAVGSARLQGTVGGTLTVTDV